MRLLSLSLLVVLAPAVSAQMCPERSLGTPLGGGDEAIYGPAPIGFAFPFGGTTYTDVHICTNGFFFLSNGGTPAPGGSDYTPTVNELVTGSPRICALWNDLNLTAANNGSIWIDSSPSRCTITWENAVGYGLTVPFQVQAQLFPSGEVHLFWSSTATNNSAYNYAGGQGLVGASPGLGVAAPAASDLSTTGSTLDDTVFELWPLQSTFDLQSVAMPLIPTAPGWTWLPSPQTGCATTADYGQGCITIPDSFYEVMTPGNFDLANRTLTFTRNANGYTVTTAIPGTFVTPGAGAAVIANADDTTQLVTLPSPMPIPGGTTSFLTVGSNGNIALGSSGNGNGFAPDVGLFLAWLTTSIAASWHDYNPTIAGSGSIKFEVGGGVAYVTWDNVYSYNSTVADRFQYQFQLATGNVTIVYDTFGLGSANYLVGYSRGGASPQVGPTDISTGLATPIAIADVGMQGVRLTGNGLPIVGTSSYSYAISAVPNVVPLAFLFFGDQQLPGLDLTFLGMPGCRGYTNLNLGSATLSVALPSGTGGVALPLPNNAGLIGASLTAQAVAFSLLTPANLVASNGTLTTLGL